MAQLHTRSDQTTQGMIKSIHALHGFLGRKEDWTFIREKKLLSSRDNWVLHDIYSCGCPSSKMDLSKWGACFNQTVATDVSFPRILVGYSLGARLAMHALLADSHLWSGAILISGHPGYQTIAEKEKRMRRDVEWADRFEKEEWGNLMHDWNSQPVFQGINSSLERIEGNYSRKRLADTLRHWSLGRQEDLMLRLREAPVPILWLVGERDIDYRLRGEAIQWKNGQSYIQVISDAGHRIPWENPMEFDQAVSAFLNTQDTLQDR